MTRNPDRGLTMLELTVCLGILGVTLGSVISIFFAGSRWALKAYERAEAARVAKAVFDLADRGAPPNGWGRGDSGSITTGQLDNLSTYAQDIVRSELPLVWRAKIDPSSIEKLYVLEVTILMDEDSSGGPSGTDREIGRYYALLADRTP